MVSTMAASAGSLLMAVVGWAAEPVMLRAQWDVGDRRTYDLDVEYTQAGAAGADPQRRIAQSARLLIEVAEVDAAGGATLKLTFESLRTEVARPAGETAEVFEWPKGAGEAAGDAPEPLVLEQISGALAGSTMMVAVEPDGDVAGISGLTPLTGALSKLGADEQEEAIRVLGFFSPSRLRTNLVMFSQVDPEGRPRENGAAWRVSERLAMAGQEFEMTTAWTLDEVRDGVATVTGRVSAAEVPAVREADPGDPRLEVRQQDGRVMVEWDVGAGMLIGRNDERSMVWGASLDLGPGASERMVTAESSAGSKVRINLVR